MVAQFPDMVQRLAAI